MVTTLLSKNKAHIKVTPHSEQPTEADYNRWAETVSQASSLVKLIDGVVNNAAWAACLDAYEYLKPLPRFRQQVKGGDTAGYGYKRVFKAFKTTSATLSTLPQTASSTSPTWPRKHETSTLRT